MSACFCSGPRPGHELCPCRERNAQANETRILEKLLRRSEPTCVSRQDPGLCYCMGNSKCRNCLKRQADKRATDRVAQLEAENSRLRQRLLRIDRMTRLIN